MSETEKEDLYERIVAWASEATGGNAAFDEEYGLGTLNQLRHILGLPKLPGDYK